MKNNLLLIPLLIILAFTSCKNKVENESLNNNNSVESEKLAEMDVRKIGLNIEGMTCEIGCARTIQSKLSKTEGVKFAEINFEKKNGIVEYDANKVSEKEIVNVVEQIAGGDLYEVTDVDKAE
jgi:Cu+-exporting ATPase